MKCTGIIRKIDELGRIVLPIELRNKFNILEKDQIEIYVDKGDIILRPIKRHCILCNNTNNLVNFTDKFICSKCLEQIKQNLLESE